jgi:hypothetical protein
VLNSKPQDALLALAETKNYRGDMGIFNDVLELFESPYAAKFKDLKQSIKTFMKRMRQTGTKDAPVSSQQSPHPDGSRSRTRPEDSKTDEQISKMAGELSLGQKGLAKTDDKSKAADTTAKVENAAPKDADLGGITGLRVEQGQVERDKEKKGKEERERVAEEKGGEEGKGEQGQVAGQKAGEEGKEEQGRAAGGKGGGKGKEDDGGGNSKGKGKDSTSKDVDSGDQDDSRESEEEGKGKKSQKRKVGDTEASGESEQDVKESRGKRPKAQNKRRRISSKATVEDSGEEKEKADTRPKRAAKGKGKWDKACPARPCVQCILGVKVCEIYTGRPRGRMRIACIACNAMRKGCSFKSDEQRLRTKVQRMKLESDGEDFGSEYNEDEEGEDDGDGEEEEEGEEEADEAEEGSVAKGKGRAGKKAKGKGKQRDQSETRSERVRTRARSAPRPTVMFEEQGPDMEWIHSKFQWFYCF